MRFLSATVLSAALAFSSVGASNAAPYVLDKSHTVVTFQVDHLGFSMTHGFFTDFDADINFDVDAPEKSSVTFTINTNSVNTLWEARDKHVRDKDFLNVEKFPEIVFKSTSIEMTGSDTAKLTGELTILDQTHEEVFDVTLRKTAPSPFDKTKIISGFSASGEIDRTKYGVSYAAPAVASIIPVQIELEISPAK